MMIAPASANVIGKLAHGIADDMLTTTAMACKAPMLIVPTMNTNMYENPILQDNLKVLASYGRKLLNQPAVCLHAEMWEKEKCRNRKCCFNIFCA